MCIFTEQSSEYRYTLWQMASLPALGAFGEEKFLLFVRCLEDECTWVKPNEVKPSALGNSCFPHNENLVTWVKN